MRTVFLVLALAYSAYSADFSSFEADSLKLPHKTGSDLIMTGTIDYVPPSYQDVLDLMTKIRKFPVKRILGVYEQLVAGMNYWVVYQDVSNSLCVLYFRYIPWVAPRSQFSGVSEDCRPFLYVPTDNKVLLEKQSQRSTNPLAYRKYLVDYDASASY